MVWRTAEDVHLHLRLAWLSGLSGLSRYNKENRGNGEADENPTQRERLEATGGRGPWELLSIMSLLVLLDRGKAIRRKKWFVWDS
jgi:hypothetical protein